MSNRRIIGVDWNAVGRGALGVGHVTGKLLLNAFAGGAGVSQIDELQEKGGQLPDWAAKAPTLVATKPTKVVVLDKNDKPRTFENSTKVTVRGGKRTEVDGGAIVEGPNKVEIEQPSGTQRPEVKAILVTGGVQPQEQPQQGLGSIVRVTGDLMDDMDDSDVNLEVVSEPSDEGTIDVFGEISSDRSVPLEMRLAQHRLSQAQARLAATQAKQPRTPAALPPMNIQNYDFQNLAPSGMTMDDFSNLDAEFTDVLGHSDDAGWTEIYGDPQGWEEIVGGMSDKQRKKLAAYLKKIKGVIVSGDVDGCDEVLGAPQGWEEIIGGMSPAQKKKLQAYLKKIKKVILSGEWDEIVGEGDSDYFVGVDALGEDERPMALHAGSAMNAQVVEDAFDGDFEILGAVPGGAASRVIQPVNSALTRSTVPQRTTALTKGRSIVPQRSTVPTRTVSTKAGSRPTPSRKGARARLTTKRAAPSKKPPALKVAIDRATKVVKSAKNVSSRLNAKLKQIKAKVNGQPTSVRGDIDILGALANAKRPSMGRTPTTARQKAAARNLERARKKLASAITKAQSRVGKTNSKVTALSQNVTKAQPILVKLGTKMKTFPAPKGRGGTAVRGDDPFDVLGLMPGEDGYNEQLDGPYGSAPDGTWYDSPQPGYDTGAGTSPTDSSTDDGPLYTSPTDNPCVLPAEVTPPARGQALSEEEAMYSYDTVPLDGIPYQLGKGLPADSVGSASVMYDATGLKDGYKFGTGRMQSQDAPTDGADWVRRDYTGAFKTANGGRAPDPEHYGANNRGSELSEDDMKERKRLGWGEMTFWKVMDRAGDMDSVPAIARDSQARTSTYYTGKGYPQAGLSNPKFYGVTEQVAYNWGPLVGNPKGPLAGLRYAINEDKWFWLPQHAPAWATHEADRQTKVLSDEARRLAQEACDEQKALDAIDDAERERNRAATEYDLSMATNQQEVEAAINADKLAQAQAAADAQLAQQQAQMEMQADQAYLQWQIQQAKLEQQTQAAALQYAMQNPEEVQQYEQAAPGGEQGFDEAPAADGFVNEGSFEGTTTDRAEEEELMEQVDRVPEELDFVPQEGAIDFTTIPEEF